MSCHSQSRCNHVPLFSGGGLHGASSQLPCSSAGHQPGQCTGDGMCLGGGAGGTLSAHPGGLGECGFPSCFGG